MGNSLGGIVQPVGSVQPCGVAMLVPRVVVVVSMVTTVVVSVGLCRAVVRGEQIHS